MKNKPREILNFIAFEGQMKFMFSRGFSSQLTPVHRFLKETFGIACGKSSPSPCKIVYDKYVFLCQHIISFRYQERFMIQKTRRMKIDSRLPLRAAVIIVLLITVAVSHPQRVSADQAYGFILPESSYRNYSYDEVASMPLQVVCYAKNEIYARNGRTFQSAELQNYFNQQFWYTPVYSPEQFTADMLNSFETANVDLLTSVESAQGMYALDAGSYSYDAVYAYTGAAVSQDSYSVNPDNYIFYDSDRRLLESGEIAALSLQEVCYAKNEIYARRGRIFNSQELSNYFSQKNWYWGTISPEQFSDSILNEIETANIASLSARENELQSGGYVLDQPGYTYDGIGSYTSYGSYSGGTGDYLIWDSSIRYLTDADVSSLSLQQLCYARNEIYARRGYIFQTQELRNYFSTKPWYNGTVPSSVFCAAVFNVYETANIELLKKYEYSLNPNGYQLY